MAVSHLGKDRKDQLRADIKSLRESGNLSLLLISPLNSFPFILDIWIYTWYMNLNIYIPIVFRFAGSCC